MGKRFIIKGADFSENAISQDTTTLNITSLMTFVDNIHGVSSNSSTSYKAVYPRFDLSEYMASGWATIQIVVKSEGCFPFVSPNKTGATNGDYTVLVEGETYLPTGTYTFNLADARPGDVYFGLNIKKSQTTIEPSDELSDYIEIILK